MVHGSVTAVTEEVHWALHADVLQMFPGADAAVL